MKHPKYLNFLIATAMTVPAASAAIIAQDDFDIYTDGALIGQGSAGSGWVGGWSQSFKAGTGTGFTVTSGSLSAPLGATEAVNRQLSSPQGADGTTVYIGIDYDFGGFFNAFMATNGSGNGNRTWSLDTIGNNTSGLSTGTAATREVTVTDDNATHRYVVQIDFGAGDTDLATLYRDGTLVGATTATKNYAFDHLEFFEYTQSGPRGGVDFADNLIVATTFNEAAMIPEPSSMALLGLAGLGLLRRRR